MQQQQVPSADSTIPRLGRQPTPLYIVMVAVILAACMGFLIILICLTVLVGQQPTPFSILLMMTISEKIMQLGFGLHLMCQHARAETRAEVGASMLQAVPVHARVMLPQQQLQVHVLAIRQQPLLRYALLMPTDLVI